MKRVFPLKSQIRFVVLPITMIVQEFERIYGSPELKEVILLNVQRWREAHSEHTECCLSSYNLML